MDENLLCLFSGEIEERVGSFVIEVPDREVEIGSLEPGETYRVGILSATSQGSGASQPDVEASEPETPVDEGDVVDVEIENLGDQGDGIARVGPGYVVIVPETEPGERVAVEITEARENVAFAEVVERHDRPK
ncbi:MAG: TRAM domain-containing protein [Halobacteriales archaeon]